MRDTYLLSNETGQLQLQLLLCREKRVLEIERQTTWKLVLFFKIKTNQLFIAPRPLWP